MLKYKNLRIIPTYHGSLDFNHEVRKIFYQDPPDLIAVEFPPNLKPSLKQGIARLPKISLLIYYDELLEQQLYIPIIPSDSLIETIRLGTEYGIPIEFIDLFVKDYDPIQYNMPDSYCLDYLSLEEFYNVINTQLQYDINANRQYLQQGLIKRQQIQKELEEQDLFESEGIQNGENEFEAEEWLKKTSAIEDLRNQYMAARLAQLIEENPKDKILVILGMNHWAPIKLLLDRNNFSTEISSFETDISAKIYNILEEDLSKISVTTPNIIFQYELFRSEQKKKLDSLPKHSTKLITPQKFDQFQAIQQILTRSIDEYKKEYQEHISHYKIKSLMQYIRNLPMIEGKIRPQLFEIVLAAKSIINDDFAWIVWELCKSYTYAQDDPKLDSLQLTNEGIILNGKYFKIRRHLPVKVNRIKLPLKPKPKEKFEGEWREAWNENRWNLVSYLPEDLFEENYFQHIRKRTMGLLRNEYTQIHEFKSTLLDGIDFRETIRNWAFEKKIYVREERPLKGGVDSIIVIFNEDEKLDEKYPYRMMWYAEHEQESDLAFYSTFPGTDLIGPGISRIKLGGVVSFFPPRGIPNIWDKKFTEVYPMAKTKAERLLLAAIIFSTKPYITYIAQNKPRELYYRIARHVKIKIIFIHLDRFNPISLRALRNLHVLAGKTTRDFAHKYIRKRKY